LDDLAPERVIETAAPKTRNVGGRDQTRIIDQRYDDGMDDQKANVRFAKSKDANNGRARPIIETIHREEARMMKLRHQPEFPDDALPIMQGIPLRVFRECAVVRPPSRGPRRIVR
jgi:hypothetical protein